jgi:hypothetical protein
MSTPTSIRGSGTEKEARDQLRLQIAAYLQQQPESIQASHRWMKRLEVAGLGIILAAFVVALYVSIDWKNVSPILIPVAWFIFALSAAPVLVMLGIHTLLLRAFPPIVMPGKLPRFVTGSAATWFGVGYILLGLALAAFWGYFAYAVGTFNLAMLEPLIRILGVALGAVIAIGILLSMAAKIVRFR